MNQWEAFVSFSIAMLLCLVQQSDWSTISSLGNHFLAVRVMYNIAYILGSHPAVAVIRTAIFTVGVILIAEIFYVGCGNMMYYP